MLLGEPSPGLAKIQQMSAEQLIHKIETLIGDQTPLKAKLAKLEVREDLEEEAKEAKVKETKDLIKRLAALETIARDRLKRLQDAG